MLKNFVTDSNLILLVEDEAIIAHFHADLLTNFGYRVVHAQSGEKALEILSNPPEKFNLVLMDIDLGDGLNGIQTSKEIQKNSDIPILFLSSHAEKDVIEETESVTSFGYILKNSSPVVINASIKMALKLYHSFQTYQITNDKLIESQKNYIQVVDSIREGIWIIDKHANTTFVNHAMSDMLGYSEEEMIGKHLFSFMDDEGLEIAKNKVEKRKEGISESHEFSFIHKSKQTIHTLIKTNPILDENGNYIGSIAFIIDITLRKKLDISLNQYYTDLLQRQFVIDEHAFVMVTDLIGNIKYVNNKMLNISKYSSEELINKEYQILNSGYHSNYFFQNLKNTVQSGKTWNDKIKFKAKDGNFFWLNATILPLTYREGKIEQIIIISSDITELVETQEKIKLSEQFFLNTIDSISNQICVIDGNGKIVMKNQSMKDLIEENSKFYSDSFKVDNYFDLIKQMKDYFYDNPMQIIEGIQKVFHKKIEEFEIEVSINLDNQKRWFHIKAKNFKDESGFISISNEEITERKKIELAHLKSETLFRSLFDLAPFGIVISDLDTGKFIQMNKKMSVLMGYTESELYSKTFMDITYPEDLSFNMEKFADLKAEKIDSYKIEKRYIRKDGTVFWGVVSVGLIHLKNENKKIIFGSISDITDRKERELKLKENSSKLETLNATKDKFFNIIAHDLMNPFAGIIGISELLESHFEVNESDISHQNLKYIELIHNSAKSAFELLENLMSWAKSQTGELEFHPIKVSIQQLIKFSLPILEVNSFKKKIEIISTVDDVLVYVDESSINTVIRNLLTNAIKFSYPNNKILITSKVLKDFLEIQIQDFGAGIDQETLDSLFSIDKKKTNLGTEQEKGSGLGLILCKEFVELNGGKISVESELGNGSRFIFTLKLVK